MAQCPQYPMQNMENQNCFDLEQALRAWGADCASRPGISADNARELESDLRERVADFIKQGLNEKEAFSKGLRQVGSPGELAREFGRENPIAVWRERLFWIVAAGFGVSVWSLLTAGPIWLFVSTFADLLPLPHGACVSLASNLPLLAFAVLVATGRLENVAARMRFFGRGHLALSGACLLAAGLVVRLFGPNRLTAPESLLVMAIVLSLWPLTLLCLGIGLFRPGRAPGSVESSSGQLRLPVVVWRERVFWMAVGSLASGVWQSVSMVSMAALFYTGDINRPYLVGPVFIGSFLLIELTPLIVLGLLLRLRIWAGKDATAGNIVRSRAFSAFIPVAVCAWAAAQLVWPYFWKSAGANFSFWSNIAAYYFAFQWLWPAGLALLTMWLAPRGETHTSEDIFIPGPQ
jgi:hypothetical protein